MKKPRRFSKKDVLMISLLLGLIVLIPLGAGGDNRHSAFALEIIAILWGCHELDVVARGGWPLKKTLYVIASFSAFCLWIAAFQKDAWITAAAVILSLPIYFFSYSISRWRIKKDHSRKLED